jgi:CDP-glucose 4,6-dehydratase
MFNNIYYGKKVLITGNTGFKGSWLTVWLLRLGAKVVGISKDIPTKPSMFEVLKIREKIKYYELNICDSSNLSKIFLIERPDFVFHLAAQPIVSISYKDPLETISSNVIGTSNVLEALRSANYPCVTIMITSDKAYDNVDQLSGYKENDQLGGKDVYSGSKGAAELIIKSYFYSFFNNCNCNNKIAIGRAGNVIGGGDWAKDRIVVDCVKAWSSSKLVEIRSPESTRPWQHVLEPLSGYLSLAEKLSINNSLHGEAFNFGPGLEQNQTVRQLIEDLSKYWNFDNVDRAFKINDNSSFHESELLKLNCEKALSDLEWQASLSFKDTIKFTSEWYFNFYKTDRNIFDMTIEQIQDYENIAKIRSLSWTK